MAPATQLIDRSRSDQAPATSTVRFEHLTKSFGSRTVLDDVGFDVPMGQVVALLGQNGSGKSTLIKILTGYHEPDSDSAALVVDGMRHQLPLRHDVPGLHIAAVHQDLALLSSASVAENLLIERLGSHSVGPLSWPNVYRQAQRMLDAVDAGGISPRALISELKPVQRAMVAIAKAIDELPAEGGLLILDEVTAFLTQDGIDQLFDLIRAAAARGVGILFVSHRMEEIWRICDRAVVLRNGQLVRDVSIAEITSDELVADIVGQRLDWLYPDKHPVADEVRVCFRAVSNGVVRDFDLEARAGEIIGLTGLRGMGYERVVYALYGEEPGTAGTMEIAGRIHSMAGLCPRTAFQMGLRLVPSERLLNGAVGSASLRENASLPLIESFVRRRFISLRAERDWAFDLVHNYAVSPPDPEAVYSSLSGGNQQKVLMARWLETRPAILLLDEPTQGVDVGARRDIFSRIMAAAQAGMTVVYATSETQDLAELCHRVLVFRDGRVAGELSGPDVTEEAISRMCWAAPSELAGSRS